MGLLQKVVTWDGSNIAASVRRGCSGVERHRHCAQASGGSSYNVLKNTGCNIRVVIINQTIMINIIINIIIFIIITKIIIIILVYYKVSKIVIIKNISSYSTH